VSHAQDPQPGYAEHFRHMIAKIDKLPREERSAMGNIERFQKAQGPAVQRGKTQRPTSR